MGAAQGQYRGPSKDAEEQYAGGDGAAQAGTEAVAARTRARKAHLDALAAHDLHEVHERVDGTWQVTHLRNAHTGRRVELP